MRFRELKKGDKVLAYSFDLNKVELLTLVEDATICESASHDFYCMLKFENGRGLRLSLAESSCDFYAENCAYRTDTSYALTVAQFIHENLMSKLENVNKFIRENTASSF